MTESRVAEIMALADEYASANADLREAVEAQLMKQLMDFTVACNAARARLESALRQEDAWIADGKGSFRTPLADLVHRIQELQPSGGDLSDGAPFLNGYSQGHYAARHEAARLVREFFSALREPVEMSDEALSALAELVALENLSDRIKYRLAYGFKVRISVDGVEAKDPELIAFEIMEADYARRLPLAWAAARAIIAAAGGRK